MGLMADINKQLQPGENIVVSLPGSFGEAFVVTDKRALVVRESESTLNVSANVYGYQLSSVTGAEVLSSGTGGYIELKLTEPAAEIDQARIYFPSYDMNTYKAAADYIASVAGNRSQAVDLPTQASTVHGVLEDTVSGTVCPKCGAAVSDRSIFCNACGNQLRVICINCGNSTRAGSSYCESCGQKLMEYVPLCVRCGKRVQRWMAFCPDCGAIQQTHCLQCGAQVITTWKYCASCGRLLGSDQIDPRSAGAAQRRLQQYRDEERFPQREESSKVEPLLSASTVSAEGHNQRGRELFENDDNEGAVKEFEAAVLMDPNNASYHCNLAVAYDECDRDEEAFAEYEKALAISPNDLTALLSLGYMYSEKDDLDEARKVWHKILDIAPDSAEAQEVNENLRRQGEL